MPGAHNGRNAALAIGAALIVGRTLAEACRALDGFRGPEQRCVVRELPSGCVLVDDTYDASPSSLAAALDVIDSFDPRLERVLLLGDMLDLGADSARWHEAMAPRLASMRGAHVRLYGGRMPALAPLLPEAASVGRAARSEDPCALIDLHGLERSIVLVKGSRGMALERAVAHVTAAEASVWNDDAIGIGVIGVDAGAIARAIRATIRAGGDEMPRKRVFIRALHTSDLERGEAQRHPYHVAVLTRCEPLADPESELAAIAQLFVHLRGSGTGMPSRRRVTTRPRPRSAPSSSRTARQLVTRSRRRTARRS
jgi:hypothetical protein